MTIADQAARQRFTEQLERNFSVIASAGSGKTRAITDRIVEIARGPQRALEWLPQLVVVTYTNRAADEMQQRTRQQILEAGLPLDIVEAFGRAFFGTIHAFCMKLLARHTRASSQRIIRAGRGAHAPHEWLPLLVLVPHTNRAAEEMQTRTRRQTLEAGLVLDIVEAFGRSFFEIIHAFCMKLPASNGH